MAATANTGDPLEHPGYVREEEVIAEERYDSDSDDDDVDRYLFLARQPAPAAEASDEDHGEVPGGGGGGDGCGRKRHLSTILSHALPAAKKARLGLAAPSGASAEDFGTEEPGRSAERFRGDLDQGNKKNKKRRRCSGEPQVHAAARGKRSNRADIEATQGSQHRGVTAGQKTSAAEAEALAGAPRRFVCSLCGKCFGSHQALGGHVHLGHTKKAKNAIAAATSHGDSEEKAAVAASPQESDGDGKKIISAASCHQDFDSSSGDSHKEEMHGDHRGDGYVEGEKVTVATSRDATDGTESRFAVGICHGLAATGIGNANSIVLRKMQYRCEVCGKECLSGQALGGHMRKHRKLSPHNGGKELRSPEVAIGAGHGKEKTAVAAASPGESDGDVDGSLSDSESNEEEMFIGAARHGDADSNGNGTGRKVAVGRCHELAAIANANSIVGKMQYRCEVCGKECLSGQALGGHMRKHWKRPPHNGGKERRSPEVANGAAHGQEKTAGGPDGDGKKIISAAACHQDLDSSSGDSDSNVDMFIDAANHRGNGHAVEGEKVTIAANRNDAHGNGNVNGIGITGIGNVNGIVRKTQHKCEVCGKECFSGQALGGHMRKHRKLSPHIDGKEPDGAGHGQEKTAVAESPGEPDGYGNKGFHAAACHQDVDSSSGDSDSNEKEMFIGAAKHGDADGTERKATGAIGNANSIARKTLQYRCELCGKEYLSGQALGGHMRKHRKLSPHDGGNERRSPEVNGMPNHRAAVITGNRQLSKTTNSPFDGSWIGWL